ncbi:MAG: hypothetical protein AAGA77_03070 [Bacteroidota bacterium]
MRIVKILFTAFLSFMIFVVSAIIGLVFYSELGQPYNSVVGGAWMLIGVYLGWFSYKNMRRRGILEMLSGNNASYDADDLKPTLGHGVLQVTPKELYESELLNKLKLRKYTIAIWGDRYGRKLDKQHRIDTIEYEDKGSILSIEMGGKYLLKIRMPKVIHISETYFKIINAKEILWQVTDENNKTSNYSYLNTGKKIETKTNTNWKPKSMDLGIGMHALYLQALS